MTVHDVYVAKKCKDEAAWKHPEWREQVIGKPERQKLMRRAGREGRGLWDGAGRGRTGQGRAEQDRAGQGRGVEVWRVGGPCKAGHRDTIQGNKRQILRHCYL